MKNSMKDQPPERNRRSDLSPRRFEANIALVLLTTLAATWVLFERSSESAVIMAAADFPFRINAAAALAAIVGAVVLNFAFVKSEIGLELVKPVHLKHLKESNPEQGGRLQKLIDNRARYVAACNLGSQTARLLLVLISFLLAPGLAPVVQEQFGIREPYLAILLAALIILIPVAIFNLVAGELIPKSLAALHPERVTRQYRFIRFFGTVFAPMAALSTWVANVFTARLGARATFDVAHQAEEEIKTLVESAQESGAIEDDEKELLHSVFEFTDTVAREVMTPRVDLDAVSIHSDPVEVVKLIEESGHSRIPIFEETDDQIVGIVHAKDLLLAMVNHRSSVNLRELMRTPLFVPENKNLHELLAEMRNSRNQLAIVQDEFGGTSGIVTIEDIIEELVGDIQDEYDEEEPAIVQEDGFYLVDGKTHLDDFNDIAGSNFDSDVFDTVGGYVFGLFGRQPKDEESVVENSFRFTVVETDGKRVVRLRVERIPDLPESDSNAPRAVTG
jgi:putative hemolysin